MTSQADQDPEKMRGRLRMAAMHFSVMLLGDATFGRGGRSIGSRVTSTQGERWLRVSWSQEHWIDGEWWTGNHDAAGIVAVPKPTVLDMHEWEEDDDCWGRCRNRAEIMPLVGHAPCSRTPELRTELDLPQHWWTNLRRTLDTLAQQPTRRGARDQEQVSRRLLSFFGSATDPAVKRWATAHGDLNWSNLTQPTFVLLDWESWGVRMAGYDAATLYVLSLRAPETAKRVYATFADLLDGPDGVRAQLFAVTRYLKRVEHGEFTDYADHLHRHARRLISS